MTSLEKTKPKFPTMEPAYRGIFAGQNFVTPIVHYTGRVRDGVWFELSSGSGIFDPSTTLWGVTVRRFNGERLDPDPSGCFGSKESAVEYICELSRRVAL